MSGDQFVLGRHEAAINQLLKNDEAILLELATIRDTLAEQRGARKSLALVWSSAGGIVGASVSMLVKLVVTQVLHHA